MAVAHWTTPQLLLLLVACTASGHELLDRHIRRSQATDRAALVAFYTATNGEGWTTNTGWNSGASYCDWYGVTCSTSAIRVVTALSLMNNSLTGSISSQLSVLTSLELLELRKNTGLTGTISEHLGSLTALYQLLLYDCISISGSIPSELSSLKVLQYLELQGTRRISGVLPNELFALTSLRLIRIGDKVHSFHALSGTVGPALSSLTALIGLEWSGTRLSGSVPEVFSRLTLLQNLELQDNQLSGYAPTIQDLSKLTDLYMNNNSLSGYLPELYPPLFAGLVMEHNRISGSVPPSPFAQISFVLILINDNALSGTLPILDSGNMIGTAYMSMMKNALSGVIPSTLTSSWTNGLLLSNNALSGTISQELSKSTRLEYLTLGANRLSGSSSPDFAQWTKLRLFSIGMNPMDWDLSLLKHWPVLTYMIAVNCQMRGTLPDSLVNEHSVLQGILLSGNHLSGTMSEAIFQNATNLETIGFSKNLISGSLPESMVSLPLATSFLLNSLQLSGTLPPKLLEQQASSHESRRSVPATVFSVLAGQCVVTGTCVTSPSFPLPYADYDVCHLRATANGFLSTSLFDVEYSNDFLQIGHSYYTGKQGPQLVSVTAGTNISFTANWQITAPGWQLCWSESRPVPTSDQLQTLGLSRNFLRGSIQTHSAKASLRTLIFSNNYFSCEARLGDNLEHNDLLGIGTFEEPAAAALRHASLVISQVYPNSDPWPWKPLEYDNIVLAFSGNSQLVTGASALPQHEPDDLLRADYIRKGSSGVFSGYTASKQLFWVALPVLVLGHLAVVVVILKSSGGGSQRFWELFKEYLRLGVLWNSNQNEGPVTYAYSSPFRAQLVLAGLGLCLGLLCALSPDVFQDCVDPLAFVTVANTAALTTFQWSWVLLSAAAMYVVGFSIELMERNDPEARTRSVYRCLTQFAVNTRKKRSIIAWRENLQHGFKKQMWRRVLFVILHIPFVIVGSVPAIGFVLMQNSPRRSEWYINLFGNSLMVTLMQICFMTLVAPWAANRLSLFRHGKNNAKGIYSSEHAIRYHKTQVSSVIALDIATVLVAPLVAIIFLDEGCLRYYLWFVPKLQELLEAWSIGDTGLSAYRPQFCMRQLAAQFSHVWVTTVLVAVFVDPAWLLVQGYLSTRAESCIGGCIGEGSDTESEDPIDATTIEDAAWHAHLEQAIQCATWKVASACRTMLATYTFGILVPPLLLLSPLSSWLNLCAIRWSTEHCDKRSFGEEIACKLMVNTPISTILTFVHLGNAVVMISIFIDFQFLLGPIIVYSALYMAEIASMRWIRVRWKNQAVWKNMYAPRQEFDKHAAASPEADEAEEMELEMIDGEWQISRPVLNIYTPKQESDEHAAASSRADEPEEMEPELEWIDGEWQITETTQSDSPEVQHNDETEMERLRVKVVEWLSRAGVPRLESQRLSLSSMPRQKCNT